MDHDYDSSFMMMRMLAGPAMGFAGFFISITITAPLVLYLVARWKSHREPAADPHLGLKFALHYFAMLAFQVALGGMAFLLYTLISNTASEDKGDFVRAAMGVIVPSGIVLAAQLVFLQRTNDAVMTGVRRLFLGYNMLSTGIVGFIGLVLACEALFAKGSTGGMGHVAASMVVVYCGAWIALAVMFGKLALGGPGASAMMPPSILRPGAPPAVVAPPPAPVAAPLDRE